MQNFEIMLFYVPCPSIEAAKLLSQKLLAKKMIACCNFVSAQSSYFWENVIQDDNEIICLMKTLPNYEQILENEILSLHPYACPCIARTIMRCNEAYFEWVKTNLF